ncbi:Trypanosomal VSG domain [Trypanosoma vivax]|nr:Trypanosomal VSG domain [Trypanosoma vivax]
MLAAWRAVCLAALSAALATTLATGDDAAAGDTVRDFGLVCNVFRHVLQARGVAKAEKARADEVQMAVARAWHGTQEAQVDQGGVKPGTDAIKKIAEAKKLSERATELADMIDTLSYTAILGNISERPDTRENESNELFRTIAGGGTNTGFADAQSGAALSNDMMWLCNVAGATGTSNTQPFSTGGDKGCPCTIDGAAAKYLESGEFWTALKATGGTNSAQDIARNWKVAKKICLTGTANATLTEAGKRKPLSAAHALTTAVTRVMAAINTDGQSSPSKRFCLGQRKNSQTCDGDSHATACVCYDQHKGPIPWSDRIAEMETHLEALQDVMTQLDQLRNEAEGLKRTRDQEHTRAAQAEEDSQTRDAGQRAGNGENTQNSTPEQPGNRKKRTAEQGETNDDRKAEMAGQGTEECGPAHPAWNTDTKTCSTTRRRAHVTAILTLLATALAAQDTRMAQQILQ